MKKIMAKYEGMSRRLRKEDFDDDVIEVFHEIKDLPDPVPSGDGHYKSFDTLYGTTTSEEHRPSLQTQSPRRKSLPFVASVQHARNTNLMVQCEECNMWRLIYSRYKLTAAELLQVNNTLDEFTCTCGASFSDLNFSSRLVDVCATRQRVGGTWEGPAVRL